MTRPISRIALAVCLVWAAGVIAYLALRRGLTAVVQMIEEAETPGPEVMS